MNLGSKIRFYFLIKTNFNFQKTKKIVFALLITIIKMKKKQLELKKHKTNIFQIHFYKKDIKDIYREKHIVEKRILQS